MLGVILCVHGVWYHNLSTDWTFRFSNITPCGRYSSQIHRKIFSRIKWKNIIFLSSPDKVFFYLYRFFFFWLSARFQIKVLYSWAISIFCSVTKLIRMCKVNARCLQHHIFTETEKNIYGKMLFFFFVLCVCYFFCITFQCTVT